MAMKFCGTVLIILFALCSCVLAEDLPVLVRAENITVPPSTGPNTHILVSNRSDTVFAGKMQIKYPDGWEVSPSVVDLSLEPKVINKIPITINRAVDLKSNSYPVEIVLSSGGVRQVFNQKVFVLTTPVFSPKIDGNLKDWDLAVPVTFITKDRKTKIMTGWDKKNFSIAVEVAEDDLSSFKTDSETPFDAVQFAIAPRNTKTPEAGDGQSQRYEFLLANLQGFLASDKCFLLIKPGDNISGVEKDKPLGSYEIKDAKIFVRRKKDVTVYECSIPFAAMPKIKAMTGRDFLMSFLVHDPDGTGIRDLGQACGLWEFQRNKFAWSNWNGAKWDNEIQFDSKIEWAFSTSKH